MRAHKPPSAACAPPNNRARCAHTQLQARWRGGGPWPRGWWGGGHGRPLRCAACLCQRSHLLAAAPGGWRKLWMGVGGAIRRFLAASCRYAGARWRRAPAGLINPSGRPPIPGRQGLTRRPACNSLVVHTHVWKPEAPGPQEGRRRRSPPPARTRRLLAGGQLSTSPLVQLPSLNGCPRHLPMLAALSHGWTAAATACWHSELWCMPVGAAHLRPARSPMLAPDPSGTGCAVAWMGGSHSRSLSLASS